MKKKLHKLNEQEVPYEVVAIICPESHLKMAWLLNSNLGYELKEVTAMFGDQVSSNSVYMPTQKDSNLMLTLIKNRFEGNVLFKSLPNVDFLLKIEGHRPPAEIKSIMKDIKSIPEILGAILLDSKKTKELLLLKGI